MTGPPKPLTFNAVDGLGFATAAGRLADATPRYIVRRLGPLFEMLHLIEGERLPTAARTAWLSPDGAAPIMEALQSRLESWVGGNRRRLGFIRAARTGADADPTLVGFLMDAQRAARDLAGFRADVPGQLAAAMEELENNIHEHSEHPRTGILAFRAAAGVFEFVAADRGIGVLSSLRNAGEFRALSDHGRALELTLTDGVSRFGRSSGRGLGFRPLFVGLANLRGTLRFRSGNQALLMDGTHPNLTTAQIAEKPWIDGFLASVRCTPDS